MADECKPPPCKFSEDVERRVAALESAFPRNEDGKPDFYGHRTEHKFQTEATLRTERRIEKIINWAIIAVLSSVGLFLLRAALLYLPTVLQKGGL